MKWLQSAIDDSHGQKNPPEKTAAKSWSEKPTGNGRKSLPEQRSEKPTDIEIKQRNKTYKQSGEAAASVEKLKEAGFDDVAARTIAGKFSFDRVERQIQWIDRRKVKTNRLGMLRKAIEQDWPAPSSGQLGQLNRLKANH